MGHASPVVCGVVLRPGAQDPSPRKCCMHAAPWCRRLPGRKSSLLLPGTGCGCPARAMPNAPPLNATKQNAHTPVCRRGWGCGRSRWWTRAPTSSSAAVRARWPRRARASRGCSCWRWMRTRYRRQAWRRCRCVVGRVGLNALGGSGRGFGSGGEGAPSTQHACHVHSDAIREAAAHRQEMLCRVAGLGRAGLGWGL